MSNNDELVSVIIPTYNRFNFLLKAIESVKTQSYKNIEIIVINDCSTEPEYYNHNFDDINIVHLKENMKKTYNCSAAQGLTRMEGIKIAKGKWVAFLDDDDTWFPNKLKIQMDVLKSTEYLMCSTNMLTKNGKFLKDNVPAIITEEDLKKINYINLSTVVIHKDIIDKVGSFKSGINEDYDYWKRCLKHINCIYISEPLVYYDLNHGNGKEYS